MKRELFGNIDGIGQIYFNLIYGFYNEPLAFSCQSDSGRMFFLVRLGTDEPIWLMSEISDDRLNRLENDQIEMREVFLKPEKGCVNRIDGSYDPMRCECLMPEDISDDMLPYPGEYLQYHTEQLREDVVDIAFREKRAVMEIAFEKNDRHDLEISCTALSEALSDIQTIVYSLADKEKKTYGKYSLSLRKQYELNVTDSYTASFGIQMKSQVFEDMDKQRDVNAVVERLNRLFQVSSDSDKLNKELYYESSRTVANYYRFLNTMRRNNLGFAYNMARSDKRLDKGHINTKEVDNALGFISSNVKKIKRKEEYEGKITKIDIEKGQFSFSTEIDSDVIKISGRLCDQMKNKEYVVPSKAKITVETTVSFDKTTGKERYGFLLIGLTGGR